MDNHKTVKIGGWALAWDNIRARMCKGVKQLVLSICQFVSQTGEKFLNLSIDRVKLLPKLAVALTL